MIKNFSLDLDLGVLEDFFSLNMRRDVWEIEQISSDSERGKYPTVDDMDNALFVPMKRLEIAMRAVYYELTSIIEWEMRLLSAHISQSLINDNKVNLINLSMQCPFNKIIKTFSKMNIELSIIPEWNIIQRILDIANSFKHRKGLKRLHEMKKIPDYCELGDPDDVLKSIDGTRKFLIELKKTVLKK
jgi:hypothetical protein